MPKIETDIDACEVVLQLAPETNGHVAVKAWKALGKQTGLDHTHLALYREDEKIRFRDIQAQPRKIISSPTWSGIESRDRVVQRRLHQRARDDPMAHPDRAPAVLHGSPVDDGVWRGLQQLPPAGGPEDHGRHPGHQAQRQHGNCAELHHAAPEVGHSLHLQRQPDDAHAEPRRPRGLAQRRRRQERRHRGQRLDRGVQHQRRHCGPCGGQPARQSRHDA